VDFEEALAEIEGRVPTRMVPDLTRISHIAELLDNPQRAYPTVHVTGTNGKTTTSRMITALLEAHGVRAGTYTSPHLQKVTERIAVRGVPISEESFADTYTYLDPFLRLVDSAHSDRVTYFEALTAMAFVRFADELVDAAVFEVGMGGIWDATNLVHGEVAVITRVGLDHPELGSTPLEVAREKAGIIKQGSVVVSEDQAPEVAALIDDRAGEMEARLLLAGRDLRVADRRIAHGGQMLTLEAAGTYEEVFLPLHGGHQARNAALALAAAEAFMGGRALDAERVRDGFAEVRSPGRIEVAGHNPLVVLDGAHNPDGARTLAGALREAFIAVREWTVVLACLRDKDIAGILEALRPLVSRLIVTRSASPRAASVERMVSEARAAGLDAEPCPGIGSALEAAASEAGYGAGVVVTGSLYTVGEARGILIPGRP